MKMLICIKRIAGIRFYHVVPVNHLTARLSDESRIHRTPKTAVAKELTALLLNSYFPQGPNVSANTQLQRTMTFLLTEPSAASVFYANLANHLEVESVVKFIGMLLACLESAVKEDQNQESKNSRKGKKRRRRQAEDEQSDSATSESQKLSASNTALMASLTETIAVLWESIESDLSDSMNESTKELSKYFTESNLLHILSHFERKARENVSDDGEGNQRDNSLRICSSLLKCAGRLPPERLNGLLSHISSSLYFLSEGASSSFEHISPHLALLCLWGMTDEVAKALAVSIESSLGDDVCLMSLCLDEAAIRRNRRISEEPGDVQEKVDIPTFPPNTVWKIIDSILRGSDISNATVRDSILTSDSACNFLEVALERGILLAERLLVADSVSCSIIVVLPQLVSRPNLVLYRSSRLPGISKGPKSTTYFLLVKHMAVFLCIRRHKGAVKKDLTVRLKGF